MPNELADLREIVHKLDVRLVKVEQVVMGNGSEGIHDVVDRLSESVNTFRTDVIEWKELTRQSWWKKHSCAVRDVSLLVAMATLVLKVYGVI